MSKSKKQITDDDIEIRDFHLDTLPVANDTPRYTSRHMAVYLTYSLLIITSGILLLVSVAPIFSMLAVYLVGLCLATVFYQLFMGPADRMRNHYQFCFHTIIISSLIGLLSTAAILSAYWYSTRHLHYQLSHEETALFTNHSYLFWVFLPVFVYVIMRSYRGWTNVLNAKHKIFTVTEWAQQNWQQTPFIVINNMLIPTAAFMMLVDNFTARVSGAILMSALIIMNMIGFVIARAPDKRPAFTHVIKSFIGALALMMMSATLIGLCFVATKVVSYIFALSALNQDAYIILTGLNEWLTLSAAYFIFAQPAIFLLYRSLCVLGLFRAADEAEALIKNKEATA